MPNATPSLPDDDDATRVMSASDLGRAGVAAASGPGPSVPPPASTSASASASTPSSGLSSAFPATSAARPVPASAPAGETLPGGARAGALPVRQVGRYQILERLGRGGMATVFKAHDPGIGRDVAVKFLHATLCEDEQYRARFLREARAAGALSHPHIVTVHDVGEIEGRPYMAMELLEGQSLAQLLEPGRPLPLREVVQVGVQLARALDYAHARGIVHRDIKPGNICRLTGSNAIKVMDFGIAHMEDGAAESRTRVGDVLGTPQYMSPEQTAGARLDGRSDLFSVGIVLYQMITGQRPFQAETLVSLAVRIAREEPTPIERLRPDAPPALRRVVERCLAKSPDRRFASGAELAQALERVGAAMDEAVREGDGPRIVPLRVQWTATLALVVAVVMGATAAVVTQRQTAALSQQTRDTGAAITRFIAAQNAESALAEEWVKVDATLQEIMKTRDFDSVTVVDRAGQVRAASDASRVGQPWHPEPGQALGDAGGGVHWRRLVRHGGPVLAFDTPITYAGKTVGRVELALDERPLVQVARLSIAMMALLVLVTVGAVAAATWLLARRFARPIGLVIESMGEIAKGRVDLRLRESRRDEFGLLYRAFDQMAEALQARAGEPAASAPAPTPAAEPPLSGSAQAPTGASTSPVPSPRPPSAGPQVAAT